MNNYFENEDGTIYGCGYQSIPFSNSIYSRIISKVEDGEATIEAWEGSQRQVDHNVGQADIASKAAVLQQKLDGILISGVMCSATAEDQHGLADIESFVLGGQAVNFHFENGNKLVLTADNWASFRAAWVAFRFSFFPI